MSIVSVLPLEHFCTDNCVELWIKLLEKGDTILCPTKYSVSNPTHEKCSQNSQTQRR